MPDDQARDYDDIPGTYVFDGRRSRRGYPLNTFLMSLNAAGNRPVRQTMRYPATATIPREDAASMLDELERPFSVRTPGRSQQRHVRLLRSAAALSIVTSDARTDEVRPAVAAAERARHDVVGGHGTPASGAVLAPISVALEDVASGKRHRLTRRADVNAEPDHGRQGHRARNGPDHDVVAL